MKIFVVFLEILPESFNQQVALRASIDRADIEDRYFCFSHSIHKDSIALYGVMAFVINFMVLFTYLGDGCPPAEEGGERSERALATEALA